MNVATGSNTADTAEEKSHECKCIKNDKSAEYERLIRELKAQLSNSEQGNTIRANDIKKLKAEIQEIADRFSNENKAKEWAQKEYCRVQSQLEKTDAELENKKGVIANLDKTLQRYERENRALRQLVELWI